MLFAGVLAGGRSSRMGEDKAGLELAGKSLLVRASEVLADLGADQVFLSGRPELAQGIPDLKPHCGPPGGLYSLLHHIKENYGLDGSPLLLIPVDMPLLRASSIKLLLEIEAGVLCSHFEGEVFPCVMRATEALYSHMQDLFAEGEGLGGRRSMKGIMAYLEAVSIPSTSIPQQEFLNANTPQDWQQIQDLFVIDAVKT